jgi:CcmD family protein
MKVNILTVFLLVFCSTSHLFAGDVIDTALHSSGKIYLVVGTLAVIFIGIIVYLFTIDKKLTNIENQIKDNE